MSLRTVLGYVSAVAAFAAPSTFGQGTRLIDRAQYADRLRGMWLGESIGNWTGIRTEGQCNEPPFLTDADWGTIFHGSLLGFVTWQNPWLADDNTDIDYVYLHLLHASPSNLLSPAQITDGWIQHINRFIWVSNARARALMDRGMRPPATGMGHANSDWLAIDAQLTTESIGAYCPGMPEEALRLADLPIRTTASGHAMHAAQFFVVLFSLASQANPALSGHDKAVWLVTEARRYLPDTSKAADIVDFVLADFLANPDVNDWESTRDKIYERYQLHAAANGFVYRTWTESSINFAATVMELLYGQCDYKRTVQIGTLSGWDSDCSASTAAAVVGLVVGREGIQAAFAGTFLSDRYDIFRTRDHLPTYLPGDPQAQDTFSLMAARMLPIAERAIRDRGGYINETAGTWLLPPPLASLAGGYSQANPGHRLYLRSANNMVRLQNGKVTATSSVTSNPPPGMGSADPAQFANGFEGDFSGRDQSDDLRVFYSTQGAGVPPGTNQTLEVTYSRPVEVFAVRFIEGDHFAQAGSGGGWFQSVQVEVQVGGGGGAWVNAGAVIPSEPLDPTTPFQIIDFVLPKPVQATGVRIRGPGGGTGGPESFVTCAELDALSRPVDGPRTSFDINADGAVDVDDLYTASRYPVDLDGNGVADAKDYQYLEHAVRWTETRDMQSGPR